MSSISQDRELDKLRIQIDQLKVRYDRYFLGLDRRQPLRAHEELKQTVRRWRAQPPPRNTGVRFKLNSLISKFSSYDRYWERILKEMDDGRFSRDKYNMAKKKRNMEMLSTFSPGAAKQMEKRKLRAESGASGAMKGQAQSEPPAPEPADPGASESETVTASGGAKPRAAAPASETAATAKAVPGRRPAPRSAAQAGANQQKLQKTYKTFMAARKKTGESTAGMSYDKVMRQFEKKIPDFKKRHGCRDVQFKVVIKDGKAKIKAVPVK